MDDRAHPASQSKPVGAYDMPRENGSFDFDCDGTEEPNLGGSGPCNTPPWQAPIPACGEEGLRFTGWDGGGDSGPCGFGVDPQPARVQCQ